MRSNAVYGLGKSPTERNERFPADPKHIQWLHQQRKRSAKKKKSEGKCKRE